MRRETKNNNDSINKKYARERAREKKRGRWREREIEREREKVIVGER